MLTVQSDSMNAFKISVGIFALLPLLTAIADIAIGVVAWEALGVHLTQSGFDDPVLDSQVRFLATIWFAYGLLLLVCLRDLDRYSSILRGALIFAFIGGIARVISIAQLGMPESGIGYGFIVFALVIEFVFIPALILWHNRLH